MISSIRTQVAGCLSLLLSARKPLVLSPVAAAGAVTPKDQCGVGEAAGAVTPKDQCRVGEAAGAGDRCGKLRPTAEAAATRGVGGRWIPGYEPFIVLSPFLTARSRSHSSPLAAAADLETKAANRRGRRAGSAGGSE
jgi:hypothetical protein